VLLTSVDREGTGSGYDLALTREVAERVGVPVIASGGAGSLEDVRRVLVEGHADAVAVASMLHYHAIQSLPRSDRGAHEGNTEFLRSGRQAGRRIVPAAISEVAEHVAAAGFVARATAARRVHA
jgi:cyclase